MKLRSRSAKKKLAHQLSFDLKKRGGRRLGAGRPSVKGGRKHEKRPRVNGRDPLHVTIRLREGMASLRQKDIYSVFERAAEGAREKGLRLIHFALLSNHVHLLIEVDSFDSLTRGIKSLTGALAKALNKFTKSMGSAFKDRYHLHFLKTPTEVRHALRYILANEAKHRKSSVITKDIFSSAALVATDSSVFRGYRVMSPSRAQLEFIQQKLRKFCSSPLGWLLRQVLLNGAFFNAGSMYAE